MKKRTLKSLAPLLLSVALFPAATHFATNSRAQDRPDPEQFRQMMMDRFREMLEVKGDDDWKIIQERIQKVMDARMAAGGFGFPGMGPPGGPRRDGPGGPPPDSGPDGGPGGGGPPPGGPPPGGGFGGPGGPMGRRSPEAQALQQALEAKASPDEIKAKLDKLREARKASEAKLEAAQQELRMVLGVRQEAAAVLAGLLK
jgi:hypothetical protein